MTLLMFAEAWRPTGYNPADVLLLKAYDSVDKAPLLEIYSSTLHKKNTTNKIKFRDKIVI
jgi:hypothetical protein